MPDSINVKVSDLHVNRDGVALKSAKLATALIHDPQGTVNELKTAAPGLTVDQIHIDDSGRVVITNQDFAHRLAGDALSRLNMADNGVCGVKCGGAFEIGGILEQVGRVNR